MELIDFRKLGKFVFVAAVMRNGVVWLGHTDLGIGSRAGFAC